MLTISSVQIELWVIITTVSKPQCDAPIEQRVFHWLTSRLSKLPILRVSPSLFMTNDLLNIIFMLELQTLQRSIYQDAWKYTTCWCGRWILYQWPYLELLQNLNSSIQCWKLVVRLAASMYWQIWNFTFWLLITWSFRDQRWKLPNSRNKQDVLGLSSRLPSR